MKTQSTPLVRASISFPADIYQTLEELAKQKKVSLAWVVRDAVEKYLAQDTARGAEMKRAAARLTRRAT